MKKMLVVFVIMILLLTSCSPSNNDAGSEILYERFSSESVRLGSGDIGVVHDNELDVTCFYFYGYKAGGLSCIPDWQLTAP